MKKQKIEPNKLKKKQKQIGSFSYLLGYGLWLYNNVAGDKVDIRFLLVLLLLFLFFFLFFLISLFFLYDDNASVILWVSETCNVSRILCPSNANANLVEKQRKRW